ncbi:MAG TPA: BamA/TamA family outer membrane protein [Gemmatimonadales bacterium]|jgi:outer membrane protein assembly factor BamA
MWSIRTFALGARIVRRAALPLLPAVAALAFVCAPLSAQLSQLVVHRVKFSGNTAIDPDLLAASIATTESSFFVWFGPLRWTGFGTKQLFDELQFRADVYRLQILYKRSGYPNVKIDTVVHRTPTAIDVTFRITQGDPVRLTTFDIVGLDSVAKAYQVRRDLPIAAGDVASDYKLHDAADTIMFRLRNRGYPIATVTLANDSQHVVSSTARLLVHTGRYSRFGPIHVGDTAGVDTALVVKLLAARTGQEYRLDDIVQSQRILYNADLYRLAVVSVDTAHYTVNDTLVPLIVAVEASAGHRAKASAGYGTDDCLRLGAGWTARNFPGDALVFDVTGQLSKIGVGDPLGFGLQDNICHQLKDDSIGSRQANYALNASLRRGAFLSPNNSIALSVFATRRSEFEVYQREEVGTSLSLTRNTSANVPITLTYRIANGTTTANPASFCAFFNTCDPAAIAALQQRRTQGTLTLSIQRQRLNNPLDPLRGYSVSAAATTSSKWLGSSTTQQFSRLVGDASGFLPVNRTWVLAGHIRGGVIVAPQIDIAGDSGNFVPPDQRFYAGGANDVRGYDQNELGPIVYVVPTDSVTSATPPFSPTAVRVAPTGGTRVVIANLEMRIPTPFFAGRLRVAAFVDAGALWNSGGPSPLRVTPGMGLRYSSPLGPIRFDVGYNAYDLQAGPLYEISTDGSLTRYQTGYVNPRTSRFTLHFSIGQAF